MKKKKTLFQILNQKFNDLSEFVIKFLINIEYNSLDEANELFDSYK